MQSRHKTEDVSIATSISVFSLVVWEISKFQVRYVERAREGCQEASGSCVGWRSL